MFDSLLDWIAHHPQQAQWILMGMVLFLGLVVFRVVLSLVGRVLLVVLCLGLALGGSYVLVRIRQGRLTKHSRISLRARVVKSSWKKAGRRCRIDLDIEHLALETVSWGCGRFEPDRTRLLPASCRLTLRCGRWLRIIESGGTCRFASGTGRVSFTCSHCPPADAVSLDQENGDLIYSEGGRRIVAKLSL